MEINKLTLDNGLRVVHHLDTTTQMVALNIVYDVGARDENPEHTGFAHLFEHLMFGGSMNIPDYDSPLQNAGGENNAWTNSDITNYYLTVPSQNAETAFWLESDRMLALDFNENSLNVQRSVVTEEFKQRCLNQPYGDYGHIIRDMAFKVHPYRWPVIGKCLEHIADATLEEVQNFFYRFYAPNNAVLAVTGNISWDETKRLAEKWFSPIPMREVKKRELPQEPKQAEERRMEIERDVPVDALFMAFKMCGRDEKDFYTYDMLTDIMASGASSRLIDRLIKKERIFSSIDAYVMGTRDQGLLQISGKPVEGVSLNQAESAIWEELEKLKSTILEEKELEKIKNKFESTQIFNSINYLNVATNLAWFELTDKAEAIDFEVERYRKTDVLKLQDIAKLAFRKENSNVLYYKSKK